VRTGADASKRRLRVEQALVGARHARCHRIIGRGEFDQEQIDDDARCRRALVARHSRAPAMQLTIARSRITASASPCKIFRARRSNVPVAQAIFPDSIQSAAYPVEQTPGFR
jgi:hypothetical protein